MFTRNCPICGKERIYKSKESMDLAEKRKSICFSCVNKTRRKYKSGTENPNYGKKKTQEQLEHMRISRKRSGHGVGKKNSMYGRSLYDVWLKNFGKEIADQKLFEIKERTRKRNSGKGNPMYGKPSPNGSGNGWKGWYNGWFFRSLLELSYMIYVIERFKLNWENGEKQKFRIKYFSYDGHERTYCPDFVINGKYVIEIKPIKLHTSSSVQLKKEAAEKWCKEHNMIYKLRDVIKISLNEIKELVDTNKIVWSHKYQEKFDELLLAQ